VHLVESKQAVIHLDLQVGGHLRVDGPGITSSTVSEKESNHPLGAWDGRKGSGGCQSQYLTGPEVKKESGRVPSLMSFITDKDRLPRRERRVQYSFVQFAPPIRLCQRLFDHLIVDTIRKSTVVHKGRAKLRPSFR
jgi:hypothetical protein